MTTTISPSENLNLVVTPDGVEDALKALEAALSGELILPGDEGYDESRLVRDANADCFPAVVVRAANAADVALGVGFARKHSLALSVRSGGHSLAAHSTNDGGIVIDLRNLNGVSVDPVTRTAKAQPGVTSEMLCAAAQPHGLALSTGDTGTVALGGLTLGGGIGWIVREQGLTIDNLISVEMVTADGRVVRASAGENADLFWALRGGGGNFGIVTEFELRLHEVGMVLAGIIALPPTPEVIRAYADYALQAPESLTTICMLMHTPPMPFVPQEVVGQPSFMVMFVNTGDLAAGEAVIEPLRRLAKPMFEMVAPMPYPAVYEFNRVAEARSKEAVSSVFLRELSDGAIESILRSLSTATPECFVQLRTFGGQMSRVGRDETAYAHRDASYLLLAVGGYNMGGGDGAYERQWAGDFFKAVQPYSSGVYVNFLANEPSRLGEAYPEATLQRLAEVKRIWDPENVFCRNQNVKPAQD